MYNIEEKIKSWFKNNVWNPVISAVKENQEEKKKKEKEDKPVKPDGKAVLSSFSFFFFSS